MWDDFESLMRFDYDTLIETEKLYFKLIEFNENIILYNKKLLFNYNIALNKAHINVLYNMIYNIELREDALLDNAKTYEKIHNMKLHLIELAKHESYLMELRKIPIFD
jgi:hypothetical protein